MKLKVQPITPDTAAAMLKRNTNNRPVRKRVVDQYSHDMEHGHWRLTHQGIAFDSSNRLIDGQHRLMAVIQSGVTVDMLVATGVDDGVQISVDDHAKRSDSDSISIARGTQITRETFSTIRAAIQLSTGEALSLTKSDLDDVLDRFRPALDFVFAEISKRERGVTSSPVLGAICLAYFYVDDIFRLKEFIRILLAKDLPTGDSDRAALSLRDYLVQAGCKRHRYEVFKKTQRAIFAFCRFESLTRIVASDMYYRWPLEDARR